MLFLKYLFSKKILERMKKMCQAKKVRNHKCITAPYHIVQCTLHTINNNGLLCMAALSWINKYTIYIHHDMYM